MKQNTYYSPAYNAELFSLTTKKAIQNRLVAQPKGKEVERVQTVDLEGCAFPVLPEDVTKVPADYLRTHLFIGSVLDDSGLPPEGVPNLKLRTLPNDPQNRIAVFASQETAGTYTWIKLSLTKDPHKAAIRHKSSSLEPMHVLAALKMHGFRGNTFKDAFRQIFDEYRDATSRDKYHLPYFQLMDLLYVIKFGRPGQTIKYLYAANSEKGRSIYSTLYRTFLIGDQ